MTTNIQFKAGIQPMIGFAVGYENSGRNIMLLFLCITFEIRLGKRKTKYDL